MRRILPLVGVAAVASAVTAAAIVAPGLARGGDDGPGVFRAFGGGDEARAARERFEACMRERGFELGPDAEVRIGPDGATLNGEAVDAAELRAAIRACGPPFAERGLPLDPDELDADARERLERIQACVEGERA